MNILVLNTGSSSLKLSLFELEDSLPQTAPHPRWDLKLDVKWESGNAASWRSLLSEKIGELWTGKDKLLSGPDKIDIVGHRIVHGGPKYLKSVLIDQSVKIDIDHFAKLAPLHNEINLDGIIAVEAILPKTTKQVAVFDTAFHRSLPLYASLYPVPYDWYEDFAIHKFGFHGINYQYCSLKAAQMLNRPISELDLIICHLGSGCSLAAIKAGKSVDTTMGFTPLDGLMMSTRSGGLDPGILIYMLRNTAMSADDLESALNHSSGLLGISQKTADLKKLIEDMKSGSKRALLAFDMYTFRIRRAICQMRASLDRLDAIIFTAGVGEQASIVRETVCHDLSFLGINLDSALNQNNQLDSNIASKDSPAQILIIEAREDWQIACECFRIFNE
jgi:acetate kinase